MSEELQDFLVSTPCIDCDNHQIIEYARAQTHPASPPMEKATRLYYAVRDDIRYDPYNVRLSLDYLKASYTLQVRRGYCVSKAVLLAAACRAAGIPSRLGFADVRNHLTTERLQKSMGTDLFVYHGYTELFLKDRWVKATPTFNRSLCDKFNVKPLEFDGMHDSVFHAFDAKGNKHMEYVQDHGPYADVPLSEIVDSFKRHYPDLTLGDILVNEGDFEKEAQPL